MAAELAESIRPGQSRHKRGFGIAAMHDAHRLNANDSGKEKGSTHKEWSLNDRAEAKSKVVAETREEGFVVRRLD